MSELDADIGVLIRVHRMRIDISQGDLADKIGLSRPSLANIERADQRIYIGHLAKHTKCRKR